MWAINYAGYIKVSELTGGSGQHSSDKTVTLYKSHITKIMINTELLYRQFC